MYDMNSLVSRDLKTKSCNSLELRPTMKTTVSAFYLKGKFAKKLCIAEFYLTFNVFRKIPNTLHKDLFTKRVSIKTKLVNDRYPNHSTDLRWIMCCLWSIFEWFHIRSKPFNSRLLFLLTSANTNITIQNQTINLSYSF